MENTGPVGSWILRRPTLSGGGQPAHPHPGEGSLDSRERCCALFFSVPSLHGRGNHPARGLPGLAGKRWPGARLCPGLNLSGRGRLPPPFPARGGGALGDASRVVATPRPMSVRGAAMEAGCPGGPGTLAYLLPPGWRGGERRGACAGHGGASGPRHRRASKFAD